MQSGTEINETVHALDINKYWHRECLVKESILSTESGYCWHPLWVTQDILVMLKLGTDTQNTHKVKFNKRTITIEQWNCRGLRFLAHIASVLITELLFQKRGGRGQLKPTTKCVCVQLKNCDANRSSIPIRNFTNLYSICNTIKFPYKNVSKRWKIHRCVDLIFHKVDLKLLARHRENVTQKPKQTL